MRFLLLSTIAFALQAQESIAPAVEQLQSRIAFLERKLQIYQQAAFNCQDARIDDQARQTQKPEGKK